MIVDIIGRRELGKTTLALYLARQSPTRVLFDPRLVFPVEDPVLDLPDDRDELLAQLEPAGDGQSPIEPPPREVVVQPAGDLQRCFDALGESLATWIRAHPAERISIVIDEAGMLDDLLSWDWLYRCAPRATVGIILTAHRPVDIPTSLRALIDVSCVFRTTLDLDLDALAERCGEEFANDARQLAPRQFLWFDHGRASIAAQPYKSYTDPAWWYVPLSPAAPLPMMGDRS